MIAVNAWLADEVCQHALQTIIIIDGHSITMTRLRERGSYRHLTDWLTALADSLWNKELDVLVVSHRH